MPDLHAERSTVGQPPSTPAAGSGENDFGTRRAARERALELLYEADIKGRSVDDVIAELPVPPDAYAVDIASAAQADRSSSDELLGRYSRKWDVHRMPTVDRAVLRLGLAELRSRPDVPAKVVLNEAVELAKRYSTDRSGAFVNGLLSRIAHDLRPGELES